MNIDLACCNFTGGCPEWIADLPMKTNGYQPNDEQKVAVCIEDNRLSGKVPDAVKNHSAWSFSINGTDGCKTLGERNLRQQEGYGLYY